MLSEDENRTLTQVGPGTPMGDLLRRYWQPVAAVAELEEATTKRVQLLGEFLVLFKDKAGTYGLIDARCAHRGTDLSFGIVEDCGLRCPLHGWLYDETGQCLDQPLELEPFSHEIKTNGYPIEAKAGMLWAYLGPLPAPLVPDWEPFGWEDGLVQIVFSELACNWLQCQENSIDPVDFEWLSTSLQRVQAGGFGPQVDIDVAFDEFEHGFVYRRALKDDTEQREDWSVGRTCLWPNGLFSGDTRSCHFEWRVPMDDALTLSVAWFIDRVAPGQELDTEQRVYHWYAPTKDDSGELLTSHPLNEKFAIWLSQAPILDRTKEHLLASDQGVVMLRDKLFSQIALIGDGGEPKSTFRDRNANRRVVLPLAPAPESATKDESAREDAPAISFPYLAGQPPEVEEAYRRVVATWESRPPARD